MDEQASNLRCLLVAGGAGFIGGAFVDRIARGGIARVVVVDKLTYAADPTILQPWMERGIVSLVAADIADSGRMLGLMREEGVDGVINFAAESHVDRSIDSPAAFVQSNVVGTCSLLEATHQYWSELDPASKASFRYLQVSTDEVYGSAAVGEEFVETAAMNASSPYAASKGAADQFVLAFWRTYRMPTMITRGSNTYGPRQYPEKLIPKMLAELCAGHALPLYGDGLQERDWIFVEDHCAAIEQVLRWGTSGEIYNVASGVRCSNEDLVRRLWRVLNDCRVGLDGQPLEPLAIEHVCDRPGHDRRYAISTEKIRDVLRWQVEVGLDDGLRTTVEWYLANDDWLSRGKDAAGRQPRLGKRGSALDTSARMDAQRRECL